MIWLEENKQLNFMYEFLSRLKPISIMTIVMILFVTLSPGILFLFIYLKESFVELETFKVILLGFAITSPFWIINTTLYLLWEGAIEGNSKNNSHFIASLAGSFWTIPVVYIPILLKFFWNLDLKEVALVMIIIEGCLILLIFYIENKKKVTIRKTK